MNVRKYLQDLETRFLALRRHKPAAIAQDLGKVEAVGGVYGIWHAKELKYFGATCHLNHRLYEMVLIGRHHSLNCLMGEQARGKTGSQKSAWLRQQPFRVSWMVIQIGRTEFEDYVVMKYARTLKNHQGRRFSLRSDITDWRQITEQGPA